MNKHVMQLIEFVVSKNRVGFSTFIDFSGHVNFISVRVYKSGWEEGLDADLSKFIYASEVTPKFIKEMIDEIERLDDYGKQLLINAELRKSEKIKLLEKQLSELKGA